MKKARIILLSILLLVLAIAPGCGNEDSQPVFRKFPGIDAVSKKAQTTVWNKSGTSQNEFTGDNVTVTLLETHYNQDGIWIGYKLEGKKLVQGNGGWSPRLVNNQERIDLGKYRIRGVTSQRHDYVMYEVLHVPDVSYLPDTFTLHFSFVNKFYGNPPIEFTLPLERSTVTVPGDYW